MENISDSAKRNPSNLLTIGRTIMANDRTMLAFFRTSLTFLWSRYRLDQISKSFGI
jgi:uncharacterized membrane protein YidH (DUF202 family)